MDEARTQSRTAPSRVRSRRELLKSQGRSSRMMIQRTNSSRSRRQLLKNQGRSSRMTIQRTNSSRSRRQLLKNQGRSSRMKMQRSLSSARVLGRQRSFSTYKDEDILHLQPLEIKRLILKERDVLQPPEQRRKILIIDWWWWYAIFIFSGASLLICILQLLLPPPFGFRMTSSEVAEIGISPEGCGDGLETCICPRETVCATDRLSMILLALARSSVFFDYPLYAMMFLSKAHNLNNILRRTILREWIDFADMHRVHSIFGVVIGIETMFHSFFHMLRWGINNDIQLLSETSTGVTGLIAMCATPLIVWPMFLPRLKKHMRFEIRKGLHYLSYFWAISLMCHAPSRIYFVIGIPFLLYVVDFLVGLFLRNHLIENVYFERYGEGGVALHFQNPKGFEVHKTSYVYIMCPWISKWQWHAFTAFPEPTKKGHTMLCINSSGDWTKKLYSMIKSPCLHSVYVAGPYSSEFSDMAVSTRNAIAIASGIGITPTLSLMLSYAEKKRVNVIWICRDPGLVEYFLHKVDINAVTRYSFVLIFYTGKRELILPKDLGLNFFIFRSRPNLEETISGIIAAIDSGEGLPEEMYENQKELANVLFDKRIKIALSRMTAIYSAEEMFQFAVEETEAAAEVADIEVGSIKHGPKVPTSKAQVTDIEDETESSSSANESKPGDSYSTFMNYLREGSKQNSADSHIFSALINSLQNSQLSRDTDLEDLEEDDFADASVDANGDIISVDGLEAMIHCFFGGIGEYSREDIENLFRQVDTDNSGFIDREEFDRFIYLATEEEHNDVTARKLSKCLERGLTTRQSVTRLSHCRSSLSSVDSRPSFVALQKELTIGDATTVQYMEDLSKDSEKPLDDWSMFYCGAATPIEKTLKGISKKYNIDVGMEKFDW